MPQSITQAYLDEVLRFIETREVVQQKDLVTQFSDSPYMALDSIELLKDFGLVHAKIALYYMDKSRRVYAVAQVSITGAGRTYLAGKA